jgi:hypothetical protein
VLGNVFLLLCACRIAANDPRFRTAWRGLLRRPTISAPVRILSWRIGDLSSPTSNNAPPRVPAASVPLLGIFSGKPMPDYPVPPPIWGLSDNPQSSGDDQWLQRWRRAIDLAWELRVWFY